MPSVSLVPAEEISTVGHDFLMARPSLMVPKVRFPSLDLTLPRIPKCPPGAEEEITCPGLCFRWPAIVAITGSIWGYPCNLAL